jgi:hypothetical protein
MHLRCLIILFPASIIVTTTTPHPFIITVIDIGLRLRRNNIILYTTTAGPISQVALQPTNESRRMIMMCVMLCCLGGLLVKSLTTNTGEYLLPLIRGLQSRRGGPADRVHGSVSA